MEVVSCHSAHINHVANYRDSKDLSSLYSQHHRTRSIALVSRFKKQKLSPLVCCLKSFEQVDPSGACASYTLDAEVNGSSVISGAQSTQKVLIPGLPDEERGDEVATLTSHYWEWKPKLSVHYETAGSQNVDSPPVLFLPGFGVGSFHYEKQLKDLGRRYRTWALDFVGQGMSLPREDPTLQSQDENKDKVDGETNFWGFGDESEAWAEELVFSVDLWHEQVRYFVEEVIKEPTYIVGNSLGGFMALYLAALNPELVKGVILLNATPFWGFLPNPERSPRLSKLFPWAGTFPLPPRIRKLVAILWEKISDPKTIAEILGQVYTDHSLNVDKVFTRIVEITQHPAAAASFASIMFAPQGRLTFNQTLSRCRENGKPICLVYGKQDPWVTPIWGLQARRQVPNALYYEISPAGHCPHDEVPEVVNFLVHNWIQNLEFGSVSHPLVEEGENTDYGVIKNVEFFRKGTRRSVDVQFHGFNKSIWGWVKSHFNPFANIRFQPLANEASL